MSSAFFIVECIELQFTAGDKCSFRRKLPLQDLLRDLKQFASNANFTNYARMQSKHTFFILPDEGNSQHNSMGKGWKDFVLFGYQHCEGKPSGGRLSRLVLQVIYYYTNLTITPRKKILKACGRSRQSESFSIPKSLKSF